MGIRNRGIMSGSPGHSTCCCYGYLPECTDVKGTSRKEHEGKDLNAPLKRLFLGLGSLFGLHPFHAKLEIR